MYGSKRIEDYLPKNPAVVSSISRPFFVPPPQNQTVINNTFSGYDQRSGSFTNKTHDMLVVMNITHFFLQMDLLRHLENNQTSQVDKVNAIQDFNRINGQSPIKMNLHAGGLFDDWSNIF